MGVACRGFVFLCFRSSDDTLPVVSAAIDSFSPEVRRLSLRGLLWVPTYSSGYFFSFFSLVRFVDWKKVWLGPSIGFCPPPPPVSRSGWKCWPLPITSCRYTQTHPVKPSDHRRFLAAVSTLHPRRGFTLSTSAYYLWGGCDAATHPDGLCCPSKGGLYAYDCTTGLRRFARRRAGCTLFDLRLRFAPRRSTDGRDCTYA